MTPQDLIAQIVKDHPKAAAAAGARLDRGIRILQTGMVEPTEDPDIYFVRSESNPLGGYRVDLAAKTCTCPDSGRGNICKHRCAAWLYRETRQPDPQPSPQPEEEKSPYVRIAGQLYPVEIHYITTAANGAKLARLRSFRPQDWYPMIITWPVAEIFYR